MSSVTDSFSRFQLTKLTHELKQSLFDSTRNMLQMQEHNRHYHQQFEQRLSDISRAQTQELTRGSQASQSDRILISLEDPMNTRSGPREAFESRPTPMVQIPIQCVPRCHVSCLCICHQTRYFQSAKSLSGWLGGLLLQTRALSLLTSTECNNTNCKRKSRTSLRIVYTFPQWLLARSVEIAASWAAMTGTGSSLHLRVSRVIDGRAVTAAIDYGDMDWIRNELSMKTILPTDVDENGTSLATVGESR